MLSSGRRSDVRAQNFVQCTPLLISPVQRSCLQPPFTRRTFQITIFEKSAIPSNIYTVVIRSLLISQVMNDFRLLAPRQIKYQRMMGHFKFCPEPVPVNLAFRLIERIKIDKRLKEFFILTIQRDAKGGWDIHCNYRFHV